MVEIKEGSFLKLALEECNNDLEALKERLSKEYNKHGTTKMAKVWGYHPKTIWKSLKKLGIKIKEKGWQECHETRMKKGLKEIGGIEALLKFRGETRDIAAKMGISPRYLNVFMWRHGYRRSKKEKRWVKAN
ncbi:MAG TPA: hypothetical protein ENG51_07550 [Deltaproteobacteria bacterium]|nr:hypothetical protein [Deltaproteobacteria bacterium]